MIISDCKTFRRGVILGKIFSLVCLFSSLFSQPVNLIWQVDTAHERDWIRELLAGVEVNEIRDCKYEVFMDNSIIVIWGEPKDDAEQYFAKLHEMKYKVGIIALADEGYCSPTSFYNH